MTNIANSDPFYWSMMTCYELCHGIWPPDPLLLGTYSNLESPLSSNNRACSVLTTVMMFPCFLHVGIYWERFMLHDLQLEDGISQVKWCHQQGKRHSDDSNTQATICSFRFQDIPEWKQFTVDTEHFTFTRKSQMFKTCWYYSLMGKI